MQPIYKELIQMWSDNGYTMPIEAGKYWLDNHFICAFTPDGELHKLYKYQVFDDLSIKISDYQSKKPNKTRFLYVFFGKALKSLIQLF